MALDKAEEEENRRRTLGSASRIFRGVQRSIKTFIAFVLVYAFPNWLYPPRSDLTCRIRKTFSWVERYLQRGDNLKVLTIYSVVYMAFTSFLYLSLFTS